MNRFNCQPLALVLSARVFVCQHTLFVQASHALRRRAAFIIDVAAWDDYVDVRT
jgi:hypothetical protein